MSDQKFIKSMTGYKATDANMRCRDYQFKLGEWAEIEGEIVECERGFHFCEQQSGVWEYYTNPETRVFKVEAEDVLDTAFVPGADYKRVCRRIRLVEEVKIGSNGNSGDLNSGDRNSGYRNSGNRNSGDGNATNYSSGCFCVKEPKAICFDKKTKYTLSELKDKFDICGLSVALMSDDPIDFDMFKDIPNITTKKLLALHQKHINARKK